MKAVVYARVSTDMQAEKETPIQGQIEECLQYIRQQGWEIGKTYIDDGITGKHDNRDAYKDMLADVKRHQFDIMVTWKIDRIFRNTTEYYHFKYTFMQLGAEYISLKTPKVEGPANAILEPLMAGVAEFFSANLAEDVKRSQRQVAKSGYSTGGNPPRGYKIKQEVYGISKGGTPLFHVKWEPDPEWTQQVQMAFQMLIEGYGNQEIIDRTKIVKNVSSLCTLFRNPTYIGERVYNVHRRVKGKVVKFDYDDPDVIRKPESHEAIISREIFDKAQEILTRRRPRPGQIKGKRYDFVLSGVLWCAEHDCTMTAYGSTTHKYYACSTRRKGSDCRLYTKDYLEGLVINAIKNNVYTTANVRAALEELKGMVRDEAKSIRAENEALRAEIDKTDKELSNLYNAIAGGMQADLLSQPIEERKKRKSELERELVDNKRIMPKKLADIVITDNDVAAMREEAVNALDTEDCHAKRAFINSLVRKIKMTGDMMDITFSILESPANPLKVQVAGVGLRYSQRLLIPLERN